MEQNKERQEGKGVDMVTISNPTPKVNLSSRGDANPTAMWNNSTPVRSTNIKKTKGREQELVQSKPGVQSELQPSQGYTAEA